MILINPANLEELQAKLRECSETKTRIAGAALGSMNRLIEHQAEDLTATAETGMTLEELQGQLRKHNQWLPVDPPGAGRVTLAQLIEQNMSGPRRYGYGPLRDYVLGMRVVLADGALIRSGGKVVKNVAGFDLCKLFIGSRGTLGVPVEATFKLLPKPPMESILIAGLKSVETLETAVNRILASEIRPVILDAYRIPEENLDYHLVVGLDGTEEDMAWQVERLQAIGDFQKGGLEYLQAFHPDDQPSNLNRTHALPSRIFGLMSQVKTTAWLARLGNGTLWHSGNVEHVKKPVPSELLARTKRMFDPNGVLPEL